jgi:hypothetical protein
MPDALVHICRGKIFALEALAKEIEAWKFHHIEALEAGDVADWVNECLRIKDEVGEVIRRAQRRLFTNEVRDIPKLGRLVARFLTAALNVYRSTKEGVDLFVGQGHAIDKGNELEQALKEIADLKIRFIKSWPRVDRKIWNQTEAEYARGDYQSAGDILDELQNHHS